MDGVKALTGDWSYEAVSVGVPAPVRDGGVVSEPVNLGPGWVGFDFEAAFGKPTKVVNDAAMQALGSYEGGRMLFLGLGTGLGSTLVIDGVLAPMELGHLPFRKATFEDYIGERGRKRLGNKKWRETVAEAIARLTAALEPDYVVLGGGTRRRSASCRQTFASERTTTPSSARSACGIRRWAPPRSLPAADRSHAQADVPGGSMSSQRCARLTKEKHSTRPERTTDAEAHSMPVVRHGRRRRRELLHVRVPELEDPRHRSLRLGRAARRRDRHDRQLRAGRAGVRGPERRA